MPIGLVNCLNPLGHSGQRRLQLVVGSIAKLIGSPLLKFRFVCLDI